MGTVCIARDTVHSSDVQAENTNTCLELIIDHMVRELMQLIDY